MQVPMQQISEIAGGYKNPWLRNNYKVVWHNFADTSGACDEVYSPDDRREAFHLLRNIGEGREDKGYSAILLCGVWIASHSEETGTIRGSFVGGHL